MKPYNHLVDYLHRWTVCKIGKLHVRLHHILSTDGTPFLHNHPFAYVSFVFSGGYTEQVLVKGKLKEVQHVAPAIIVRRSNVFHRIVDLKGKCKTLFVAYGDSKWELQTHPDVARPFTYVTPMDEGIYRRIINGKPVYSRFENGVWYAGSDEYEGAVNSTKLSVHQCEKWESIDV